MSGWPVWHSDPQAAGVLSNRQIIGAILLGLVAVPLVSAAVLWAWVWMCPMSGDACLRASGPLALAPFSVIGAVFGAPLAWAWAD